MPLRPHLPQGWYLIYWRAISVDGHPVQGAFTYAVGPNPGPAPQFPVPSIAGIGDLAAAADRALGDVPVGDERDRPVRVPDADRTTGVPARAGGEPAGGVAAFVIASVIGLIAIPVYLDIATAIDSLRSVFDRQGARAAVPGDGVRARLRRHDCLLRAVLPGRLDRVVARSPRPGAPVDRRGRVDHRRAARRGGGAADPGSAGHAAQTSPAGISVVLDWLHLITGSVWLGGLIGLLVLWASLSARGAGRRPVGRRAAVLERRLRVGVAAAGTGTWATINHMPALDALWLTGYGVAILVKIGLLIAAMALAAFNLLRTKPRLPAAASSPELGEPAARLLRRTDQRRGAADHRRRVRGGRALEPRAAAARVRAAELSARQRGARTGRGDRQSRRLHTAGARLPNKAAAPDSFALRITKNGRPVRGANVTLTFNHTEMQMPQQEYQLTETQPGVYSRAAPALVMVGKWALCVPDHPQERRRRSAP